MITFDVRESKMVAGTGRDQTPLILCALNHTMSCANLPPEIKRHIVFLVLSSNKTISAGLIRSLFLLAPTVVLEWGLPAVVVHTHGPLPSMALKRKDELEAYDPEEIDPVQLAENVAKLQIEFDELDAHYEDIFDSPNAEAVTLCVNATMIAFHAPYNPTRSIWRPEDQAREVCTQKSGSPEH